MPPKGFEPQICVLQDGRQSHLYTIAIDLLLSHTHAPTCTYTYTHMHISFNQENKRIHLNIFQNLSNKREGEGDTSASFHFYSAKQAKE